MKEIEIYSIICTITYAAMDGGGVTRCLLHRRLPLLLSIRTKKINLLILYLYSVVFRVLFPILFHFLPMETNLVFSHIRHRSELL